jgi:hypothetical protein
VVQWLHSKGREDQRDICPECKIKEDTEISNFFGSPFLSAGVKLLNIIGINRLKNLKTELFYTKI